MSDQQKLSGIKNHGEALRMTSSASIRQYIGRIVGESFLFLITSLSAIAVIFIFLFITKDAYPFVQLRGITEFFTSTRWYPSAETPEFGALAILVGSGLVTAGSIVFAVPLGVAAAICLSDVLPFTLRQLVKPFIEMLASIPSVAYGFFALVVFAPLLQDHGGRMLAWAAYAMGIPVGFLVAILAGELIASTFPEKLRKPGHILMNLVCIAAAGALVMSIARWAGSLEVTSGANALNVSIILGIMVLPTIVSVSEDALQAVGRELREGSYALGATRAETLLRVVLPAASSGICAAVILGLMRAVGETMVVWMASGNAAQIPEPFFNYLEPVRTLTATIAGDMGEADHVTGSARYHVLFAMAFVLLSISFVCNLASEWVVRRERRKLIGA